MNRFTELYKKMNLEEANDPSGLRDLIMMNFYKLTNGSISSSDEKKVALLTAALAILNNGSDTRTVNAARKLYQRAMN